MKEKNIFIFQLGREHILSLIEIKSVFPEAKIDDYNETFCVVTNLQVSTIIERAKWLGGTIKIIQCIFQKIECNDGVIENFLNAFINQYYQKGKIEYGCNVFGNFPYSTKQLLHLTKTYFSKKNLPSRYLNVSYNNLKSTTIFFKKLVEKKTDFNFFALNNTYYFGITIWVQNILEYIQRDTQKEKNMQIGMLPTKLAQIMINISRLNEKQNNNKEISIYDPFVGFGTLLKEAYLMGYTKLYGSDYNREILKKAKMNLQNTPSQLFFYDFYTQQKLPLLKDVTSIVTEGYLGSPIRKNTLHLEYINKQKTILLQLYKNFFQTLLNNHFQGNIIISFPFWNIKGKNIFFFEVESIIPCKFQKINITHFIPTLHVPYLLYRREGQYVGRNIYILKQKGT